MNRLYGRTILIGRDVDGSGQLCVALNDNGRVKMAKMPGGQPVPNSVSRCNPKESACHLKVYVDPTGDITLTNMKLANVTYVNGLQVMSKRISATDSIELGNEHYHVDMPAVFETAKKLVGGSGHEPTFSIKHLEQVWNHYKAEEKKIADEAKRTAMLGRIPLLVSMSSGVLGGIMTSLGIGLVANISFGLMIVGLLIMLYSLYRSGKDKSAEKRERNLEWLQENYVCPNPQCRKFLGAHRYKMLKSMYGMKCPNPNCRCNWKE